MSPPIEEWPARELPLRVYATPDGRRRKVVDAQGRADGRIDLRRCPLYELVQYACEPQDSSSGAGKKIIKCEPIVRTFRKCEQFMAEVTALESLQRP